MDRGEKRRAARAALHGTPPPESAGRPYLGLRFDCCRVYARAYRNHDRTAYVGRCPRCGGSVRIRIGSEGISARFFRVI